MEQVDGIASFSLQLDHTYIVFITRTINSAVEFKATVSEISNLEVTYKGLFGRVGLAQIWQDLAILRIKIPFLSLSTVWMV